MSGLITSSQIINSLFWGFCLHISLSGSVSVSQQLSVPEGEVPAGAGELLPRSYGIP